ncbi:membrane protein [Photobacterium angustum]|uniref:DUF2238 domain-containing protein n=1 Tax=Photobacterium angustum TaxID=661 RepID=UPI0005E63DFD|nr:DUF2238 domain-containing protein [Photobacterium angustum]KJF96144.1 membrane protein [Photobacterium angustum]KJG06592.1 membrane protein [Photobacterium angustum]PSV91601.1 DUF2238 domain-containing protein [Photobacterium angustum]PSW82430.1 DUF2238 domain-containing protein [Photobacterium angustum]
MSENKFPLWLAVSYTLFFIILGINPAFREVWIAEAIPLIIIFGALIFTFRYYRFSNLAYALMAVWLVLHNIGAHYTFANVPFDWFNDLIGSQRNNFDRLAHFSIGFYAFPVAEYLVRKNHCKPLIAGLFGLFAVMAVAAGYEIVEWWYAASAGGEAGIEFLGSQGDIWDAQKDMLADTLGAVFSLILFFIFKTYKQTEN